MHNRGTYKNRAYFSHGDLTEGFMFVTYPNPIGQNSANDGVDSGWVEFKGRILNEFKTIVNTGKFHSFEVPDEHGVLHRLSIAEVKMIFDQYINHCLERISDADEKQKLKLVQTIGLDNLAKIAGAL